MAPTHRDDCPGGKLCTLTGAYDSPASACVRRGWTVGDVLEGDEGFGPGDVVITAIGDQLILCRDILGDGALSDEESSLVLDCRCWGKVGELAEYKPGRMAGYQESRDAELRPEQLLLAREIMLRRDLAETLGRAQQSATKLRARALDAEWMRDEAWRGILSARDEIRRWARIIGVAADSDEQVERLVDEPFSLGSMFLRYRACTVRDTLAIVDAAAAWVCEVDEYQNADGPGPIGAALYDAVQKAPHELFDAARGVEPVTRHTFQEEPEPPAQPKPFDSLALCAEVGVWSKPGILGGEPCLLGTRLPVATVRSLADSGWSVEKILQSYQGEFHDRIAYALRWPYWSTPEEARLKAEREKAISLLSHAVDDIDADDLVDLCRRVELDLDAEHDRAIQAEEKLVELDKLREDRERAVSVLQLAAQDSLQDDLVALCEAVVYEKTSPCGTAAELQAIIDREEFLAKTYEHSTRTPSSYAGEAIGNIHRLLWSGYGRDAWPDNFLRLAAQCVEQWCAVRCKEDGAQRRADDERILDGLERWSRDMEAEAREQKTPAISTTRPPPDAPRCNNGTCQRPASFVAEGEGVVLYACDQCVFDENAAAFGAAFRRMSRKERGL